MAKKIKPSLANGVQVTGRILILMAGLYKGHVYKVMMIGSDLFMYLVEFNGEIYMGHNIITPKGNHKSLNDEEIRQCAALTYSGAEATIEQLLGIEVSGEQKQIVETFEANRDKVGETPKETIDA